MSNLVPKQIVHSDGRVVTHYVREGWGQSETERRRSNLGETLGRAPSRTDTVSQRFSLSRVYRNEYRLRAGSEVVRIVANDADSANEVLDRLDLPYTISEIELQRCDSDTGQDDSPSSKEMMSDSAPQEYWSRLDYLSRNLKGRSDRELQDFIAERADELNKYSRQTPMEEWPDEEIPGANGSTYRWVDPSRIVSTPDQVWGSFGGRREDIPLKILKDLRDCSSEEDYRNWNQRFNSGDFYVNKSDRGEGSTYRVMGGSHRAFFARAMELPAVLAEVTV